MPVTTDTRDRHQQHARVRRDFLHARQIGRRERRRATETPQRARSKARDPARHGEEQAFGERLLNHARAAGAERDARGQLLLPRDAAREHEVRDVDGRR